MTTSILHPWSLAVVLGLVAAGTGWTPVAAQPPGTGGQTITVVPLPDAEVVEKVPPLDKTGNFKVSAKTAWADVPALTVPKDVARGKVTKFAVKADDSKFYPGSYSRNVWVYVPAAYKEGAELPLMVVHDGSDTSNMQATLIAVLDTLIPQKRLPMMAAVFVANGTDSGGGRNQRSKEYDTVSGKFAEFLEAEVLPPAEKAGGVKFTKDSNGRGVLGASSGAAAAFSMAWFHDDLYRRVLSYSGTFVGLARGEAAPHGAWEYHENFIPKSAKKPIRVWLQVGSRDLGATSSEQGYRNWVLANNRMADALKAKGYEYQYLWSEGAGHVEKGLVRQTLGEAMEWLWATYKAK